MRNCDYVPTVYLAGLVADICIPTPLAESKVLNEVSTIAVTERDRTLGEKTISPDSGELSGAPGSI
jgi:hypothetical protein